MTGCPQTETPPCDKCAYFLTVARTNHPRGWSAGDYACIYTERWAKIEQIEGGRCSVFQRSWPRTTSESELAANPAAARGRRS